MKYEVHFGKSYSYHLGYDKDYHRIRKYDNLQRAKKCLQRANNCKWVEWTDLITNKENK